MECVILLEATAQEDGALQGVPVQACGTWTCVLDGASGRRRWLAGGPSEVTWYSPGPVGAADIAMLLRLQHGQDDVHHLSLRSV